MINYIIQGQFPYAKKLIQKEQKERMKGKQGYVFYNTQTGRCVAKVYRKGCEPIFPSHYIEVCRFRIGTDPEKALRKWK